MTDNKNKTNPQHQPQREGSREPSRRNETEKHPQEKRNNPSHKI